VGGNVGVFSGESAKIQKDIEEFQPTLLGGVPRVYSLFKERIESQFRK
jgi:long-chain acyl-CoA synthetase